jgi:glycerol kinase
MLPTPVSNSEVYGESAPEYLGGSIKICGAAGDQQAALFGQKCFHKGDLKNTYGTGCFLLMNTGDKPTFSDNGLVSTIGWGLNGKLTYALEGSVFMGGAIIQWLRDELHMINSAQETEEIALKVKNTNGCYIVPAFTGLGAPYWEPEAKGIICGLTRGVGRNHIVRAALDAIVYQVHDIVSAMEQDAGCKVSTLKVDGGASNNNYLCQTQADISDTTVIRPACVETTALGAAYLAGLAVGYWQDEADIESSSKDFTEFKASIDAKERKDRLKGWSNAVSMLLK